MTMRAFLPNGYCTLASAIERAAEARFSEEYEGTTIGPHERQRYDRYERAAEDLWRQAAWKRAAEIERKRAEEAKRADQERWQQMTPDARRLEEERRCKVREKAEAARRASACNVGSSGRGGWAELGPRPLTEAQETAARRDAAKDDEIRFIKEKLTQRKSLLERSRDYLRQILWSGDLPGYLFAGGETVLVPKSVWGVDAHWDRIIREEQVGLDIKGRRLAGYPLVKEEELAVLLSKKPSAEERRAASNVKVTQCLAWLEILRRSGPQQMTKDKYKAEAMERFGVGPDQFRTIWATAACTIPRKDWGLPGPPKKIQ
jgi:hypothetical protein